MNSASRRKGFTLIELLVVVAIIALLIAILLPSLQEAIWQSKVSSCGGNMHQVYLLIAAYLNDNDPYYPAPDDGDLSPLQRDNPIKNFGIFKCPATQNNPVDDGALGGPASDARDSGNAMSYMYRLYFGQYGNDDEAEMKTTTRVKDPGRTIILHDNVADRTFDAEPTEMDNHGVKAMNVVFCDGHVATPNNAVREKRDYHGWTALDPSPVTPPPDALERAFWISQELLKP